MKRIIAILILLSMTAGIGIYSAYADFEVSQNENPPDLDRIEAEGNEASVPEYLKAEPNERASPLGFAVTDLSELGSSEKTVLMIPGQSGTLETNSGMQYLRWAMDEEGFFTVSFERAGNYSFRFTEISGSDNSNATFGVTVIGAGGGGGGANTSSDHAVGDGGSGGEVVQRPWSDFTSGLRISSFLNATAVMVGKGGAPGKRFEICTCGGNKCPLGGYSGLPESDSHNDGASGEASAFGSITARGGAGGKGSTTAGGRDSGIKARSGSNGTNCGTYLFWGVEYNCGYAGDGGSFGVNDGPGGDPAYFHDPGTVSFGRSGTTIAGKGNGGGGSGMSYSFGHPQYSGTGTGEGMGSYSHTIEGTPAKGGDSACYNGYVYIEGRVHPLSESRVPIERYQLIATVYPTIINPIPVISWETTNSANAKVSPMGLVSVYGHGEATITATAKAFGVQGVYRINEGQDGITITADRVLAKSGDTAVLKVTGAVPDGYVFWDSTNPAVASVNSKTGEVSVRKAGTAVITATLTSGKQASYMVETE